MQTQWVEGFSGGKISIIYHQRSQYRNRFGHFWVWYRSESAQISAQSVQFSRSRKIFEVNKFSVDSINFGHSIVKSDNTQHIVNINAWHFSTHNSTQASKLHMIDWRSVYKPRKRKIDCMSTSIFYDMNSFSQFK